MIRAAAALSKVSAARPRPRGRGPLARKARRSCSRACSTTSPPRCRRRRRRRRASVTCRRLAENTFAGVVADGYPVCGSIDMAAVASNLLVSVPCSAQGRRVRASLPTAPFLCNLLRPDSIVASRRWRGSGGSLCPGRARSILIGRGRQGTPVSRHYERNYYAEEAFISRQRPTLYSAQDIRRAADPRIVVVAAATQTTKTESGGEPTALRLRRPLVSDRARAFGGQRREHGRRRRPHERLPPTSRAPVGSQGVLSLDILGLTGWNALCLVPNSTLVAVCCCFVGPATPWSAIRRRILATTFEMMRMKLCYRR